MTPEQPPKCTNPPPPPPGVIWYILGVFVVHFSRGGYIFAPERGVFLVQSGGSLVFTSPPNKGSNLLPEMG